jgi:hypothetical protein
MAGLSRLTPLPRWRRGSSHRVSDPQENPTDPVMPTESARPSRPEQATTVRRRTTTPQPQKSGVKSAPAPAPVDPVTTPIPRIKPGIAGGSTQTAGRPSAAEPTGVIPVVAAATGHRDPVASRPGTDGRSAAGHIDRQVWSGRGWVLADAGRILRALDDADRCRSGAVWCLQQ